EREVPERQDAGVAHEHLKAEHQHQVDEQLLDEQLPGRATGRGVDDRDDEQCDRQDRRRRHRSGDSQPPRVRHTRSAVVTLNNPDGRTMNNSATSPNTNASVRRCGVPSGRYDRKKTSARPSASPPTTAPVKLPRPPITAATT